MDKPGIKTAFAVKGWRLTAWTTLDATLLTGQACSKGCCFCWHVCCDRHFGGTDPHKVDVTRYWVVTSNASAVKKRKFRELLLMPARGSIWHEIIHELSLSLCVSSYSCVLGVHDTILSAEVVNCRTWCRQGHETWIWKSHKMIKKKTDDAVRTHLVNSGILFCLAVLLRINSRVFEIITSGWKRLCVAWTV